MSGMKVFNSFDDLQVGHTVDGKPQSALFDSPTAQDAAVTWNEPRGSFIDGKGGVDFRTELYATSGIVSDKAKQNEIARVVEEKPFYGEIPAGFSGFGNRKGEIIVKDDKGLRICNKSDVPELSGYFRLPEGWERAAEIVVY